MKLGASATWSMRGNSKGILTIHSGFRVFKGLVNVFGKQLLKAGVVHMAKYSQLRCVYTFCSKRAGRSSEGEHAAEGFHILSMNSLGLPISTLYNSTIHLPGGDNVVGSSRSSPLNVANYVECVNTRSYTSVDLIPASSSLHTQSSHCNLSNTSFASQGLRDKEVLQCFFSKWRLLNYSLS